MSGAAFDPDLDLVLERVVDIPPESVFKAWTTPEHLKHWFCPKPWETVECEIDLRPGGIFRTRMRGPEGQEEDVAGCWLEIVKDWRLAWTSVLGPGFRPRPKGDLQFTAVLTLEKAGNGTRYKVQVMHPTPEDRYTHEEMGFHEGWGIALDQLVAYMKSIRTFARS